MVQMVEACATTSDDLHSIPGSHQGIDKIKKFSAFFCFLFFFRNGKCTSGASVRTQHNRVQFPELV